MARKYQQYKCFDLFYRSTDKIQELSNFTNDKRMKMSSFQMENLPDEVLLTIVNYLDIKSIIKFGQVCTRTREISRDESLWRKTILFNIKVSPEFVKFILDSGCRYLSLQGKLISERKFCVFKSPKNYPNL